MTTNYLKEVVFEEVPHRLVTGDVPPSIEIKVENVQPQNQDQRAELRFESDRHQDHEEGSHQILNDEHQGRVEPGNQMVREGSKRISAAGKDLLT